MCNLAVFTLIELQVCHRLWIEHKRTKRVVNTAAITKKYTKNCRKNKFPTRFFSRGFLNIFRILTTINYQTRPLNLLCGLCSRKKSHLKWNREADNTFWSVLPKDSVDSDVSRSTFLPAIKIHFFSKPWKLLKRLQLMCNWLSTVFEQRDKKILSQKKNKNKKDFSVIRPHITVERKELLKV